MLLQKIGRHITLNPKEQFLIQSKIETHLFKSKTVLLQKGQICKYSYFLNWGVLGSFNVNDHIV